MNIGLDLGMGACKLFAPGGGVVLPSHVAIADGRVIGRLAGMKAQKPPLKVVVDGRAFYVGDGAHEWGRPVENLDYDRLTGAPEMRAIVYGALTQSLNSGGMAAVHDHTGRRPYFGPSTLYVGMPLEPLTGEGAQATVAAVRDWLRGDHQWEADGHGYTLTVADVKITSQPTGALFDYLLDDDGRFVPERKGHLKEEIGIISVGFNTVELLVVQDTRPVNRFTAGTTAGVRRLLELVNGDEMYSLGELDGRLRAGALDVRTAVPVWGREVSGAIERTWGKHWRRFARVVTVGGGAIILNGQLAFAGKSYLPDDPVLAIARGLYKMGLMQAGKTK